MEQKTGIGPLVFLDSSIMKAIQLFLIQQTRCDLLHFIYRKRAVHIHRRLVRLMTEKVLNPLGAEAFGFQKPGDGMTKEVRIEMCEARIGIGYPGFSANRLDNMVDRPR